MASIYKQNKEIAYTQVYIALMELCMNHSNQNNFSTLKQFQNTFLELVFKIFIDLIILTSEMVFFY